MTPEFDDVPFTLRDQIEARASHPVQSQRILLRQDDRVWTYRAFRDDSVRLAHFLLGRLAALPAGTPGHVAMLLDNCSELVTLYGACGYAGLTLFGINTGLRGETLAGVLDQSKASILVVDEARLPEVERIGAGLKHLVPENILVVGNAAPERALETRVSEETGPAGSSLAAPSVDVTPETHLLVIYTSGTTGLPKGIINNHFKLCAIGLNVSRRLELDPDSVGYACMPLFHSNAMFLGFQPAFFVGASVALRPRFSASAFVSDVLRYGVTYWNYVGEPVHYILDAMEREFAGDEARILADVAHHPNNRLRFAIGNGASPPDIDRFCRWLDLEDMFELYGSTEAAIATYRRRGDPRGSVGEITDPNVVILNESGEVCEDARLSKDGRVENYAQAVGEICRKAPDTGLFQGYFDNEGANQSKYRDGVYHSGDLGHILVRDGVRYLFFDGRTDDWIRKDGENFSAAPVARILGEHPDVALAAVYGVPCPVSDEWVMAALKLRSDGVFDAEGFFAFCDQQTKTGSMDPKWFPDFIRVVDDFEYTGTQKILVRNLKRTHFDLRRAPGEVWWRERGDRAYRRFSEDDFDALRERFEGAERSALLDAR